MNQPAAMDRMLVARACFVYVVLFAGSGFNQPFFPLWLSAHGITDWQISLIISAPLLLRIAVTPAIGSFADRSGQRNRTAQALACVVLLFALALGGSDGFWPILLLYGGMTVLSQAIPPLIEANVIQMVRLGIARNYGRMRLWGSVGFAGAAVTGGFILGAGGPQAVFTAFTLVLALQILVLLALPPSVPTPPDARRQPVALRRQPLLLAVFAAAAMVLTSHTVFNVFGSIYLREHGYSERAVGALWALATSAEVAMFWAGPRLATAFGPFGLLTLAAAAATLRWTLMATAPDFRLVPLLQLLHAATFSCSYLGLMRFVETNVTDERGATAQSAFVTLTGLMTAGATLAVGPIYQVAGSGAFLAAAGLAAAALVLLAAVRAPLRAAEALALSRQPGQPSRTG